MIFMSEFKEVFVLLVGEKWPEHKKTHEDLLEKSIFSAWLTLTFSELYLKLFDNILLLVNGAFSTLQALIY